MGLTNYYNYLIEECSDPRTKDWLFIHSPLPIVALLFSYYYFVRVCGPNCMKYRSAYSCKTYIKFYNVFQVISNAIIVHGLLTSGWLTSYSLGCVPIDPSSTGEGYRMAAVLWWTFMLKLIDLTETVVFVLRKKTRQISFLHVYHHISTAFIAWMIVKWSPGGMFSMIVIINSSVHVVMYSYYLLSTGGPNSQIFAGWIKPWITIIQMAQFCILIVHALQGFAPSCQVSKFLCGLLITNIAINFYLFYDFYQKNYVQKEKQTKVTE